MPHSLLRQISIGLSAPKHSVRFFRRNKAMIAIGVIPHIANFLFYIWIIRNIVLAKWITPLFHSLSKEWAGSFISFLFNPSLIETVVWIIGISIYGALGASFVNAVASPLFDIIAQKAYEDTSGKKIHHQGFLDFIDSIISEITKAVIVYSVIIISLFVHIFAPILFIASVWYLGWNCLDRTLLLINMPFRKRFEFGIRNSGICIGLGIWCYIPIIGALVAFSMAAAGAISIIESQDLEK